MAIEEAPRWTKDQTMGGYYSVKGPGGAYFMTTDHESGRLAVGYLNALQTKAEMADELASTLREAQAMLAEQEQLIAALTRGY